jgi:manganese/zinc/iron transport system permease protein
MVTHKENPMNMLQIHMMSIAIITSIACALPGVFMVLRGVALMSDAISHAILLGIVLMFMVVQSLGSPFLIFGAALAGLLTVFCTELLIATNCLKKDAAIGLVFPLFFSIAVILITTHTRDIHIDMDMVLLGELAFAPFHRFIAWNIDCGPQALWTMGPILLMNIIFIALFYKELKISIFDIQYAAVTGFKPMLIYYLLMAIVSITAVGAFDVVGSIVVVALMVTPAATAYIISHSVDQMLAIALCLASIAALGGYWFAWAFDVSIAGSIALISGVLFMCVLIFSPNDGLLMRYWFIRKTHDDIVVDSICALLYTSIPQRASTLFLADQLFLNKLTFHHTIRRGTDKGLLLFKDGIVLLTNLGHTRAIHILERHI